MYETQNLPHHIKGLVLMELELHRQLPDEFPLLGDVPKPAQAPFAIKGKLAYVREDDLTCGLQHFYTSMCSTESVELLQKLTASLERDAASMIFDLSEIPTAQLPDNL